MAHILRLKAKATGTRKLAAVLPHPARRIALCPKEIALNYSKT
jgi:hypothetical protein